MRSKIAGKIGEDYAEQFLISKNYLTICRNFHSRYGELDVVALDQSTTPEALVFVEVKSRTFSRFGEPEESYTFRKQVKMLKTIHHFYISQKISFPKHWRIDLIAVKLDYNLKLKEIRHLKDILHGN